MWVPTDRQSLYHPPMPNNLVRYHQTANLHFVTFSCHDRLPYLASPASRALFERSLETMRLRYNFFVTAYVVMPEHVHLLLSEPRRALLSKALQAIKLSVSVQSEQAPFWQKRYYDFNVFSEKKVIEKRRYIHRNPVLRGLVTQPDQWPSSSFLHWATGAPGTVEIESNWTARRRDQAPAITPNRQ
jgi:putative transposase